MVEVGDVTFKGLTFNVLDGSQVDDEYDDYDDPYYVTFFHTRPSSVLTVEVVFPSCFLTGTTTDRTGVFLNTHIGIHRGITDSELL